jgi:hypothetical protein
MALRYSTQASYIELATYDDWSILRLCDHSVVSRDAEHHGVMPRLHGDVAGVMVISPGVMVFLARSSAPDQVRS